MSVKLYNANDKKEANRLALQAEIIRPHDSFVIKQFLNSLNKTRKLKGETLYILELGGANMQGSRITRYNDEFFKHIKKLGCNVKIINAEYNEGAINESVSLHGDLFTNEQVDLNTNPSKALQLVRKKHTDNKKFDMVFSNFVLQHLKNPQLVMEAIKDNLADDGLSAHIVPDDELKTSGFMLNGKPDDTAIKYARSLVKLFVDNLPLAARRDLGHKMFDVCGAGFGGEKGANFNTIYNQVVSTYFPREISDDEKSDLLAITFHWYVDVIKEVVDEGTLPKEMYKKAKDLYNLLSKQYLQPNTEFNYKDYLIILTNGAKLRLCKNKIISENYKMETLNKRENHINL